MPDTPATPATIGYWTAGVARLSERGEVSASGATDTYTVYWPNTAADFGLSDVVSGLPDEGDEHPSNSDLTVAEFKIAEHEPGVVWRRILVVYTRGDEESEGGGSGSESVGKLVALDYPVYTQSGDLVADQVSGAPVLNSAGDVFDSVPTVETLYTGVHWTRRLSSWAKVSPQLALDGTVNAATVTIYGVAFRKRTARLRITARNTFDGSSRPWELDVTVEPRHTFVDSSCDFRPDSTMASYNAVAGLGYDVGWDVPLLDCGYQYLDTSSPPQKFRFTVTDDAGQTSAPQLPQLLTNDGRNNQDGSYPKSILIVRTCAGNTWTALKFKTAAPN